MNIDTGYAILNEVGLWKTTNRGANWVSLTGNFGEWEFQILADENTGYDAGSGLKIYKTEGDLDLWHRMFINDNFSDVFFVNEQKGFVISSASNSSYRGLYKTIDGGNNWQSVSGALDGVDLLFLDSLTGFLGASSSIYKTTDGGDTWYQTNGATGGGKIFFINQTTGWAIHSNVIYKTTDTGENWIIQLSAPSYTGFKSIFFVDSLYGWTANNDRPYKTLDGGENWVQQTNLDIWLSQDVYFANRDTGWIVDATSWNALKKTIDGGINWVTIPEILDPINFHFFPDTMHWLINGSHRYITSNGGSNWIEITNDVPTGFNGFQAPTNFLGFAVGNIGLILKYVDTTYTPVELINFSSESDGHNIVLKWTTATETNNNGFEVQRSEIRDQKSGSGEHTGWERIGFIEGNGTTTQIHIYSFSDLNVIPGIYQYRLKQIDFDGSYNFSKEVVVEVPVPSRFSLEQNYPNPFNPTTRISFIIPTNSRVSLTIFDVLGRQVTTLINKRMTAGYYNIEFSASELASGIYYYRLKTEGNNGESFDTIKKMVLIK